MDAGGLLVAGSSLTVMSGLRFVRQAHAAGRSRSSSSTGARPAATTSPTALVDAGCSETLTALAEAAA